MSVQEAARGELALLSEGMRSSVLAAAVLDLAARLDGEPTDRDAAALARELRLLLVELHRQVGGAGSEGEAIAGRVRTAALGH